MSVSVLRREGFWFSISEPHYPVPKPFNKEWDGQKDFLVALKRKEGKASKDQYRGMSTCRICFKLNGSEEYTLEGWVWPSGLKHYIQDHNVKPTQEFIDFVLDKCSN